MTSDNSTADFQRAAAELTEPFERFVAITEVDPFKIHESLIAEKLNMIRALSEDIALMLRLRDKLKDPALRFEINAYIGVVQDYLKVLGQSIRFNREVMNGHGDHQG